MAQQALNLVCPGCGAPVSNDMRECPYCGRPVLISSIGDAARFTRPQLKIAIEQFKQCIEEDGDNRSAYDLSLGCCYLSLGLHAKALESFEDAIRENPLEGRAYFNAAVRMLGGRTPFVVRREIIDEVVEYLETAIQIDDEGICHALLAFVLYDYFGRKSLRIDRSWQAELAEARGRGFSPYDGDELFALLAIKPTAFFHR